MFKILRLFDTKNNIQTTHLFVKIDIIYKINILIDKVIMIYKAPPWSNPPPLPDKLF